MISIHQHIDMTNETTTEQQLKSTQTRTNSYKDYVAHDKELSNRNDSSHSSREHYKEK